MLTTDKPQTRVFILIIFNVIARIEAFSGQEPPPGQLRQPKSEALSFVLESDHLLKLNKLCQMRIGGSREQPAYEFREDFHELPQVILVHITMEQMSVGWRITCFRVPGIRIERGPVWVNHEMPVDVVSSMSGI